MTDFCFKYTQAWPRPTGATNLLSLPPCPSPPSKVYWLEHPTTVWYCCLYQMQHEVCEGYSLQMVSLLSLLVRREQKHTEYSLTAADALLD